MTTNDASQIVLSSSSSSSSSVITTSSATPSSITSSPAYQQYLSTPCTCLHLKSTLDFISTCIDQYGIEHLAFAFNGGKDSTVLFHLLRICLAYKNIPFSALTFLYFEHSSSSQQESEEFEEILLFINQMIHQYSLTLTKLNGPYRQALEEFLPKTKIRGIFMGQKRSDPSTEGFSLITPSSKGWPPFDRINPLLDWTSNDIWLFLREHHLPYCSLYEKGYTSLGSRKTSSPHPALKTPDGKWKPAWELSVQHDEREGRKDS